MRKTNTWIGVSVLFAVIYAAACNGGCSGIDLSFEQFAGGADELFGSQDTRAAHVRGLAVAHGVGSDLSP